jgi:transaldolase
VRKLDPSKPMPSARVSLDKAAFDAQHASDQMATDKLKEGIEGFSKALTELEKQLEPRLAAL